MTFGCAGVASAMPIGSAGIEGASRVAAGARVGDTAEAWYAVPSGSLCLPIIGCLPVPLPLPSGYPAGTLHVGLTAGKESARAYVVPAATGAVKRGVVAGGSLILPIDSSPLAGTAGLSSAKIDACLTIGTLPAHATASAALSGIPPKADCHVSARAVYDKSSDDFSVDLSRFAARWQRGAPYRGIALVPVASGVGLLDNWQVAFDGKGSKAAAVVHSLIADVPSHGPGAGSLPTASASPATQPASATPPGIAFPAPGTQTEVPPVSPPQVAPTAQASVYLIRSKRFRYPAIFIAPLAILAGVIFFGRLFTGTTVPSRTRKSRHRARS
jgi:hypothetical protein